MTRIDAIFAIEREITGLSAAARLDVRQRRVAPLVNDLHDWMLTERARMSKHNPVAKAINYMVEGKGRWEDPQAWLADVLARLPDLPVSRVPELLPWHWKTQQDAVNAA